MPFDIMSGFQVGQQLAGKNAIGIMAENVLGKVNALQQMQFEHTARLQYDPEYRFNYNLYNQLNQQTIGGQGGTLDMESVLRHKMGLPLSTAEITRQAQAEQTGKNLAPLSPLQEEESELRKQQIIKTQQGITKETKPWYKRLGGTPVPSQPFQPLSNQPNASDPIVQVKVGVQTGKRVGITQSGRKLYLD